ncbi:MAG: YeeE/YedE thiosulfate transporter family protein [Minicystis sp.]
MNVLAPLVIGFAFGFVLQKGGLTQYAKVAGVFRFADLTVLKFLLSALITGAVALRLLQAAGLAGPIPVTDTYLLGNLLGGMIHGVGMALVGFCPGTVVAGAGEGRLDNLVFGIPGLFAGAIAFGFAWPAFFAALSRVGALGRITAGELFHVSPAILVLIFAEVVLIVFYLVERGKRPGHGPPAASS